MYVTEILLVFCQPVLKLSGFKVPSPIMLLEYQEEISSEFLKDREHNI